MGLVRFALGLCRMLERGIHQLGQAARDVLDLAGGADTGTQALKLPQIALVITQMRLDQVLGLPHRMLRRKRPFCVHDAAMDGDGLVHLMGHELVTDFGL